MLADRQAFIDGRGCLCESIDYKPGDTPWPHGGRHYDLAASIEECFNNFTDATRKILGFDKYKDISAKDNERIWQASEVVIDYDLSIASDAIMKSKSNKQNLPV